MSCQEVRPMLIGNLAVWLGLAMMGSTGVEPSMPGLGQSVVQATQQAQLRVREQLDLFDKAMALKDVDSGLEHVMSAARDAVGSLHPSDVFRTDALMVFNRIRYSIAKRNSVSLQAIPWLSYIQKQSTYQSALLASFAATENLDPKLAVRWADLADYHASESFSDSQALPRVRSRVVLARSKSELEFASKNFQDAAVLAEKAVQYSQGLPLGDRDRLKSYILQGQLLFRQGLKKEATSLLNRAVTEGGDAPTVDRQTRIDALSELMNFQYSENSGIRLEVAAKCLAEVERLGEPFNPIAIKATELVAFAVWERLLTNAKAKMSTGGEKKQVDVEAELRRDFETFGKLLTLQKVKPSTSLLDKVYLALFQFDQGRFAEADETLQIVEKAGGIEAFPELSALFWTTKGLVAGTLGQYSEARQSHEIAFELYYRARLPQLAIALNNLAELHLRQGDYDAASDRLKDANESLNSHLALEKSPGRATTLLNLGKCLEFENKLPQALKNYEEALAIVRALPRVDPTLECACLNALGMNRYLALEFEDATSRFEEARKLAVSVFGETHLRTAEIDVSRGWLALVQAKPREAAALFETSVIRFRKIATNHPRLIESLSYLARARSELGEKAKALEALNEALALQNQLLSDILKSAVSERDRLSMVQEVRVHAESSSWPGVLDTYFELAPQLGIPPEEQYGRLLAWKELTCRPATPRVDELENDPEIRRIAADREARILQLRSVSAAKVAGRALSLKQREDIRTIEEEVLSLERLLSKKSKVFAQGSTLKTLTTDRVKAALRAGVALLDTFEIRRFRREDGELTKDFRYLFYFVSPKHGILRIELESAAKEINAAIVSFRADIEKIGDTSASGEKLARMVWDPLIPYLKGIDLLIIAGDDLIHSLPFAALPAISKDKKFLVEEIAFGMVSSMQSLVAARDRDPKNNQGALVVGGVNYVRWAKLKGTEREAERVCGQFNASFSGQTAKLLSGSHATTEELRKWLPSQRFVHLATHGYFQRDHGDGLFKTHGASAAFDSGLVLAGTPQSPSDDILTAEEIGRLDLKGTEVVVLSACESGLGRVRAGQGVIGLVSALDRAGVRSVISTLWQVSDDGTVPMMDSFYKNLWSGPDHVPPVQALRRAQIDMIQGKPAPGSTKSYSHPFYWAAFVQNGGT
jgi:CHAT domain-containing protein/tetratricopeptide (TPR) repeat protein